jgi:hypothetical protein
VQKTLLFLRLNRLILVKHGMTSLHAASAPRGPNRRLGKAVAFSLWNRRFVAWSILPQGAFQEQNV